MDDILRVASKHGVAVVEDNAHGLFGKYKGQYLGTFGCMATQSFHETKNVSCGEGGALLINDTRYRERAEIIREKGTNRSRFLRGEVDKYTWVDIGSSYLPSELLAAFLFAQLEARDEIQDRRRAIWTAYQEGLEDWARDKGVGLPHVPPHCEQAYHMYYLLMPSAKQRDDFIASLVGKQIHAVFHYSPLHLSPMARKLEAGGTSCPVTEDISARLVRLPFFNDLTSETQASVIEAIRATPI
jgi:dTDP-4-amino-4,6-dideoxygalactose transaminase